MYLFVIKAKEFPAPLMSSGLVSRPMRNTKQNGPFLFPCTTYTHVDYRLPVSLRD